MTSHPDGSHEVLALLFLLFPQLLNTNSGYWRVILKTVVNSQLFVSQTGRDLSADVSPEHCRAFFCELGR
jgi:hypothetical protein